MKNKKLLICLGIVVLLGLVAIGIFKNRQQAADDNVIRIGAILPLTGRFGNMGNLIRAGLEEGRSDSMRILYFDTKSEVRLNVDGYRHLADTCNIFVTTTSEGALTLKPLTLQDEKLLLGIASHAEIVSDNKKLVVRPLNTGRDEAKFLVDYILKQNLKEVYIYSQNIEAGLDFVKIMKDGIGESIIGVTYFEDNYEALRSILSEKFHKNAKCIVIYGYAPIMGSIAKILRESNYDGQIISTTGFGTAASQSAAGEAAQSVPYVDYDFPYESPEYQTMNERSLKSYNTPFTSACFISYAAMRILDHVIGEIGKDPKHIGLEICNDKQYTINGVTFTAHPDGSITAPYCLFVAGKKMQK